MPRNKKRKAQENNCTADIQNTDRGQENAIRIMLINTLKGQGGACPEQKLKKMVPWETEMRKATGCELLGFIKRNTKRSDDFQYDKKRHMVMLNPQIHGTSGVEKLEDYHSSLGEAKLNIGREIELLKDTSWRFAGMRQKRTAPAGSRCHIRKVSGLGNYVTKDCGSLHLHAEGVDWKFTSGVQRAQAGLSESYQRLETNVFGANTVTEAEKSAVPTDDSDGDVEEDEELEEDEGEEDDNVAEESEGAQEHGNLMDDRFDQEMRPSAQPTAKRARPSSVGDLLTGPDEP
mmetsp:Transcript_69323/g.123473  ORF Transcript_69323/g.123473 Transcript_69323/m.123473 type:complete len:289 (-) Transcript_69323:105-971(-)